MSGECPPKNGSPKGKSWSPIQERTGAALAELPNRGSHAGGENHHHPNNEGLGSPIQGWHRTVPAELPVCAALGAGSTTMPLNGGVLGSPFQEQTWGLPHSAPPHTAPTPKIRMLSPPPTAPTPKIRMLSTPPTAPTPFTAPPPPALTRCAPAWWRDAAAPAHGCPSD